MPQRLKQIIDWLENDHQSAVDSIEPASSDASFRRYFRVTFQHQVFGQPSGKPFIIMDAPPEKESVETFTKIARYLETLGVNVPHLYAVTESQGFILMSDLGAVDYLSVLDNNNVDKLYQDAMNALLLMQKAFNQGHEIELPAYDQNLLQKEMDLLPDWYIKVHKQSELSQLQLAILEEAMEKLIESAQQQPQVFVHRDYHSRNLMFISEQNPGVIDFQDAVRGPLTYDLVSLFRDSYIVWPEKKVYGWLEQYRQQLLQAEILTVDNQQQFIRWFDWMGIQRQLKVVGIFSRLNYRDGKSNYLNDIPRTLDYLLTVTSRYQEFGALNKFLMNI